MFLNFLFSCFLLAGIGRIWGKLLKDIPVIKIGIKNNMPKFLSQMLTCSFCFTFWLSFLFVLFFDPLSSWLPIFKFNFLNDFKLFVSIFFSWMIVGTGAWIVRFVIDELQLLVHYQNHILKEKSGHK